MNRRWKNIYLVAILLAFAAVAATEAWRRDQGFRASVIDDKSLWSVQRQRISDNPRTLAVLGASRMQLGFNESAFNALHPGWTVANLTVNGRYPVATLRDLAFATEFRGVVLIALDARALFTEFHDLQQPWIDYFHRDFGPGLWLDAQLAALAQSRRVTANPDFSLARRLGAYLSGGIKLQPTYVVFDRKRWGHADYRQIDAEYHRRHREQGMEEFYTGYPLPSPQKWLAGTAPLLEAAAAIEARGGRVFMIRMPTDGGYWALDEQYFPRAAYWDRMAAQPGVHALHFRDDPRLTAYPLPDGSHLDEHDKDAFTRDLLTILEERYGWPDDFR
jgi:hypothetical protein